MLVEMRARSQITIPNEIIKRLGLGEGDKFDVMERDGGVFLCPVVVYPKAKLEQIAKIIKEHDQNPSPVYESVEVMFRDIGIALDNSDV
jgi:AbrB family looped-hinge helix DNA binding protein